MKKIIPIVFAIDNYFALPLSVTIQSLKSNKSDNVFLKIYVFHQELTRKNKDLLSELISSDCQIKFVDVTEYFKDYSLYPVQDISIATYYRIGAPLILKEYDKIIYLDADMLVKCCISELFDIDLQGYIFGAVKDFGIKRDVEATEYINAGVIVINVKEFLEQDVFNKCMKFIAENQDLDNPDQDALNEACKGKIKFLPFIYNCYPLSLLEDWGYRKALKINSVKEIKIIHYAAYFKPWRYKKIILGNVWRKEVKSLPKNLRIIIKNKYLKKLSKANFNYKIYKYEFGSNFYRFWVKVKNKLFKK